MTSPRVSILLRSVPDTNLTSRHVASASPAPASSVDPDHLRDLALRDSMGLLLQIDAYADADGQDLHPFAYPEFVITGANSGHAVLLREADEAATRAVLYLGEAMLLGRGPGPRLTTGIPHDPGRPDAH